MNVASPKLALSKLGIYSSRQKSLKVMVLGQRGVGKSALVVRFITRRYIGEYNSNLEKVYAYHTLIDNEMVYFDILDTADYKEETDCAGLEANIRWAEAFILMYSVTDKCSFDECYRLKFLINYNKRRKRLGGVTKDGIGDVPVVLVGNKIDQIEDRMVSIEEGRKLSKEIGCVCFHEISVRESIDQVWAVFHDTCRFWKVHNSNPAKLRRTVSEKEEVSPDTKISPLSSSNPSKSSSSNFGQKWTEDDIGDESDSQSKESIISSSPVDTITPFRERASTDGHLLQHKVWKWRYSPSSNSVVDETYRGRTHRRMSISMRGNETSY